MHTQSSLDLSTATIAALIQGFRSASSVAFGPNKIQILCWTLSNFIASETKEGNDERYSDLNNKDIPDALTKYKFSVRLCPTSLSMKPRRGMTKDIPIKKERHKFFRKQKKIQRKLAVFLALSCT